jgi:hypothetical protein
MSYSYQLDGKTWTCTDTLSEPYSHAPGPSSSESGFPVWAIILIVFVIFVILSSLYVWYKQKTSSNKDGSMYPTQ